jgi:molybdopterin-guanine dinucleotide biosynthesis protein A
MGRTKALIQIDGVAMAERVATTLDAAHCTPVVFVGGERTELAALHHDVVDDVYPGAGPVGGILTALASTPNSTGVVVVVACDVPFIDVATIQKLLDVARRSPQADVVVARTDRLEPGCAVWRVTALERIEALFAAGERAIHRVIFKLASVEVDVATGALMNLNRPEDIPGSAGVQ